MLCTCAWQMCSMNNNAELIPGTSDTILLYSSFTCFLTTLPESNVVLIFVYFCDIFKADEKYDFARGYFNTFVFKKLWNGDFKV